MNEPVKMPTLPIDPKVDGKGVVYKKDGTVSKPEPERKDNGCNANDRSA